MKNQLPKGGVLIILFLLALALIINSCKKDFTVSQTTPLSQKQQIDVVNEAKTWFQRNEAINKPSVAINDAGSTRKWYDGLNPAWDTTLVYEKNKGTVIEMPLLNSAVAFLVNTTDGSSANLQTNYTKTSYLIQKDSVGVFKGWFMVLIADTTYINGDFSKLDKNTYKQRDPAYSGRLMYFDINGKFAGGWRYQNGVITKTLTLNYAATTGSQQQINSERPTTTMGTGGCTVTPVVTVSWICIGSYGPPATAAIRTSSVTCEPTYNVTGYIVECSGGGGSSDGGAGGGGSNNTPGTGGNTSFPSPIEQGCKSVAPASVDGKQVNLQPPVPTTPDDPCLVKPPVPDPPKQDIIDKLDPKYPCAKALLALLPNLNSDIAKIILEAFGKNNINNITFYDGNLADFSSVTKEDGYALGYDIYLNPDMLSKSSNEYRLVVMYHEAIHAFLTFEHSTLSSSAFATKYPTIKVVAKQVINSAVGKDPYNYYISEGPYDTKLSGDPQHRTMAEYFTDKLRDAILAYNPNFPVERATALARGGIFEDTSILNFNNAERDVTKGNSVGTKCTP